MRNDILQVSKQGVKGMKTHTSVEGRATLIVCKGFNEPENRISVDTYSGIGYNYKPMETATVEINFADGAAWHGTFDELRKQLLK